MKNITTFYTRLHRTYMMRCAIWHQMLKNVVLMVGQNAVLTSQNALERLSQQSFYLNLFVSHSNSYLTFNHSHDMYMTLDWYAHGISRIIQTAPFQRCCKNCYIHFSVLKADDKIKVRRRIFTFKTLVYVQHTMKVRFIYFVFC